MSKYTGRNLKEIDLPSGASVTVRKMNGFDALQTGDLFLPDIEPGKPGKKKSQAADDAKQGVEMAKVALLECTGKFIFEDEVFKIVDKPFAECPEGSGLLPLELLDQADAQAIVDAVLELSGFGKAVADAKSFPEKQETSVDLGPSGEAVRDDPGAIAPNVAA